MAPEERKGSVRVRTTTREPKRERGTPELLFMNHGGRRKGAGRKAARRADGKRVHNTHAVREHFTASRPVHVTVRVRAGLPSLRGPVLAPVVLQALETSNERAGFRLVHFSLQTTHWHLVCEADGPVALAAAMRALNGRIAKAINKQLGRTGSVIEDRYHLEVLRTPTQVRNAVRYVLRNGEKHGVHVALRHGDVVRVLEGERAQCARDAVGGDDRAARGGLLAPRGVAACRALVAAGCTACAGQGRATQGRAGPCSSLGWSPEAVIG
jgi:REP element-mobilizing transposase RayT